MRPIADILKDAAKVRAKVYEYEKAVNESGAEVDEAKAKLDAHTDILYREQRKLDNLEREYKEATLLNGE